MHNFKIELIKYYENLDIYRKNLQYVSDYIFIRERYRDIIFIEYHKAECLKFYRRHPYHFDDQEYKIGAQLIVSVYARLSNFNNKIEYYCHISDHLHKDKQNYNRNRSSYQFRRRNKLEWNCGEYIPNWFTSKLPLQLSFEDYYSPAVLRTFNNYILKYQNFKPSILDKILKEELIEEDREEFGFDIHKNLLKESTVRIGEYDSDSDLHNFDDSYYCYSD